MLMCRFMIAGSAACVLAAVGAHAADIQGHAASYQVTVEKPPENTKVTGQVSTTLSKACDGWRYSSALFYTIERGTRGNVKSDSFQEGMKFTEALGGTTLQYEGRYHVGGRGEEASGAATLGADRSGILDVKSDKLPRKVELPAATVLPIALRGQLIDALSNEDPARARGPFSFRTIELGRFYVSIDLTLARVAALPALKPPAPRVGSPLLQKRAWTLKQTSKTLTEWMESTFELHESGVITRFTFQRDGIVWRADLKELNTFATPQCGG
ncbi:DUF1849 family protein [Reyranella sp. CPCC 100927]|nr:DUF1849 family protein [Reyranella sp. CPCC 100927]